MTDASINWSPFDCDGRAFEYAVVDGKQKTRPPGWPAHKASPGRWVPVITVVVRNVGDEIGPGMVFPAGTQITIEHAKETARRFWADLTA